MSKHSLVCPMMLTICSMVLQRTPTKLSLLLTANWKLKLRSHRMRRKGRKTRMRNLSIQIMKSVRKRRWHNCPGTHSFPVKTVKRTAICQGKQLLQQPPSPLRRRTSASMSPKHSVTTRQLLLVHHIWGGLVGAHGASSAKSSSQHFTSFSSSRFDQVQRQHITWDNNYKISRWWKASGVSGLVVGFALGLG